tara:strand:+ start:659 stop:925 length:267 start_codon:yes stop_codon:yes gene_type:complete
MKKFDVTTNHMYTQHWEVVAKSKEDAAKVVMEGDLKWDKPSRTYVSNKLTRTLVTIPDAKILAVEPIKPANAEEDNWDTISYGGTDPD